MCKMELKKITKYCMVYLCIFIFSYSCKEQELIESRDHLDKIHETLLLNIQKDDKIFHGYKAAVSKHRADWWTAKDKRIHYVYIAGCINYNELVEGLMKNYKVKLITKYNTYNASQKRKSSKFELDNLSEQISTKLSKEERKRFRCITYNLRDLRKQKDNNLIEPTLIKSYISGFRSEVPSRIKKSILSAEQKIKLLNEKIKKDSESILKLYQMKGKIDSLKGQSNKRLNKTMIHACSLKRRKTKNWPIFMVV